MKLVQKILSHGLLIAFVVAAFFAYTNRAGLFPQWFGKSAKMEQQAAAEKSDVVVAQAPAERKVTRPLPEKTISKIPVAPADETTTPGIAPGSGDEPVAPAPADVTPATPLPDESVDDETSRQEAAPGPATAEMPIPAAPEAVTEAAAAQEAQPATTAPAVATPAIEPAATAGVQTTEATPAPAPVAAPETTLTTQQAEAVPSAPAAATETGTAPAEAPVSTAPESAPRPTAAATDVAAVQPAGGQQQVLPEQQPATVPTAAPLEQRLEAARQLYWQRDVRAAAAAYQALGETHPQNPDVWGEIGNFYFSLHQREPAGEAYARCIELLIDQGEPARARQLLNILHRLDEPRARELETRIQ